MIPLPSGCSRRDFIRDSGLVALAAGWQYTARPLEAIVSPSLVPRISCPLMVLPTRELTILEDAIQNQTMLGTMLLGCTTSLGMMSAQPHSPTLVSCNLGFLGMAGRA